MVQYAIFSSEVFKKDLSILAYFDRLLRSSVFGLLVKQTFCLWAIYQRAVFARSFSLCIDTFFFLIIQIVSCGLSYCPELVLTDKKNRHSLVSDICHKQKMNDPGPS